MWSLTPLINFIWHIKYIFVIPLGVAKQLSINYKGEWCKKIHITNDCYFRGSSGNSFNNIVLRNNLHPWFFVFFLIWVIHITAAVNLKWTTKIILVGENRPIFEVQPGASTFANIVKLCCYSGKTIPDILISTICHNISSIIVYYN